MDEPDTPLKVNFTAEQLKMLSVPWGKTLMGKVLGSFVRYDTITQRVPQLWRPQGKLDIIDLGKDIFLFKFNLQSNLDRVIMGEP